LLINNDLAGFGFVPAPVEILGSKAELDKEIVGEILRLNLAAFLSPEPQQGDFIVPHNNPSIRAADERTPVNGFGHAAHDTPPS
jgi:hypothetical protein